MATMTNEQIEQKKQQLQQLTEQAKAIVEELTEAGALPLDDDDLDQAAGGDMSVFRFEPDFKKKIPVQGVV